MVELLRHCQIIQNYISGYMHFPTLSIWSIFNPCWHTLDYHCWNISKASPKITFGNVRIWKEKQETVQWNNSLDIVHWLTRSHDDQCHLSHYESRTTRKSHEIYSTAIEKTISKSMRITNTKLLYWQKKPHNCTAISNCDRGKVAMVNITHFNIAFVHFLDLEDPRCL